VNTWGAYQCYGDPDFVLVETAARARDEGQQAASLEQFVNRAEDLRAEISCLGEGSIATQIERLNALKESLARDAGWGHIGLGWAALARVYNEALEYDKAIECYEQALALEDGALTIRDLEQFANSECRSAVAKWVARFRDQSGALTEEQEKARLPVIAMLQSAIGRLQQLNAPPERGGAVTSMRQALLGSAFKRHGWMSPGPDGPRRKERIELLRQSREWYRGAATHRLGSPDRLVNWATVDLALRWHGEPADDREAELAERLDAAHAMLDAQLDTELEVWDYAARAKLMLVLLLRGDAAGATSSERQKAESELKETYPEIGRLANAREFTSVLEQLQFLADMAQYKDDDGKIAGYLDDLLGSVGSRRRGATGSGKRGTKRKKPARDASPKDPGTSGRSGDGSS
jgi:tetratricopeptide (TPR) repeat protein